MKWMGWGWSQLLECPTHIYNAITELMQEEADRYNQ
jgi:hypothetical protein